MTVCTGQNIGGALAHTQNLAALQGAVQNLPALLHLFALPGVPPRFGGFMPTPLPASPGMLPAVIPQHIPLPAAVPQAPPQGGGLMHPPPPGMFPAQLLTSSPGCAPASVQPPHQAPGDS